MHLTFNVNAFHFVHKEYIDYELYPILSLLFKSIQKKYTQIIHESKFVMKNL